MISNPKLTNLYVYRNVVRYGYPVLESILSTIDICEEAVICIDPNDDDDEEHRLAKALSDKFPKVRVVEFVWPENVQGDGTRIGIASQYTLQQAHGDYCLNVQADELYSPQLAEWIKNNWKPLAQREGIECFSFKVLNLQHNMSEYQGGNEGSTWNWQCGAGYNRATKLFRRCPAIRFEHDAWSMSGCAIMKHVSFSEQYPIVHAHDNFRDSLIDLRQNAANAIWTDREKFGHYKATADGLEATRDQWWNDPKWTQMTSPFSDLLPDFAKRLLGRTHYQVDWNLLENWQ